MSSLHEVQRAFAAALMGDVSAATTLVVDGGIAPALRLAVYRHTSELNFVEALATSFPAIQRLVGEDYFRQMALDYRVAYPSRSGDLQHVGADLEEFLRDRFLQTQYAYLSDVAALDWAFQQALVAPERASRIAERLAGLSPDGIDRVRLVLHPSVHLLASRWAVFDVWEANRHPDVEAADLVVDLDRTASRVLMLRRAGEVVASPLTSAEYAFLAKLKESGDLVTALAAAVTADATVAVDRLLPAYVSLGAVVDCEFLQEST